MKNMFFNLKPAFVLLALCLSSVAYSQNVSFVYSYDASGNRVQRKIEQPPQKKLSNPASASVITDVVKIDEVKTAIVALVYPNPTYGLLNISLENFENATYQVFDISGKEISQGKFTSSQMIIDISNEGSGQYLVKITSNGDTQSYLITKKS
ncbi:MAG: T9SS type A sorting domain-containing protein [Bacteroidetes bacterium]|nr:T9SS type A sorting domain-containing protein [Bacteroidota bacterium]